MTKIVPTDKARQGHRGTHLLIILVAGLILALIAWAGVEIYGRMIEPTAPSTASAISASVVHAPTG